MLNFKRLYRSSKRLKMLIDGRLFSLYLKDTHLYLKDAIVTTSQALIKDSLKKCRVLKFNLYL